MIKKHILLGALAFTTSISMAQLDRSVRPNAATLQQSTLPIQRFLPQRMGLP